MPRAEAGPAASSRYAAARSSTRHPPNGHASSSSSQVGPRARHVSTSGVVASKDTEEMSEQVVDEDVAMLESEPGPAMSLPSKQTGISSTSPDQHVWEGLPEWLLELSESAIPMLKTIQVDLDERYVVRRLVMLARRYAFPTDTSSVLFDAAGEGSMRSSISNGKKRARDETGIESFAKYSSCSTTDLQSAAFYAHLALCYDADSVAARKVLAYAVLHGAEPFPFSPSSAAGTSASHHGSRSSRASAQSALRILENGDRSVFEDVDCAVIYAEACRRLSRYKDAEDALSWTFQRSVQSDGLKDDGDSSAVGSPRKEGLLSGSARVLGCSDPQKAQVFASMGRLSLESGRIVDAADAFVTAQSQYDNWCWSAWTGYCDAGCASSREGQVDPMDPIEAAKRGCKSGRTAARAFEHTHLTQHQAKDFLAMESLERLREEVERLEQLARDRLAKLGGSDIPLGLSTDVPSQAATDGLGSRKAPAAMSSSTGATAKRAPLTNRTTARVNSTYQRPGSRTTTGPNAPATSKRTKPTTAAPATGTGARTASNSRASAPASQPSMAKPPAAGTRLATGTLSTSRQNVQQDQSRPTRAGSAASTAKDEKASESTFSQRSRGRGVEDKKPVTVAKQVLRPTSTTAQTRTTASTPAAPQSRPVRSSRPASVATSAVSRNATTVPARARSTARAKDTSSSEMESVVEADQEAQQAQAQFEALQKAKEDAAFALRHAVLEAKKWRKADETVVSLIQTLGEVYRCVRRFKGKRAVWLLRSSTNSFLLHSVAISPEEVLEHEEKLEDLSAYKVLDLRIRGSAPVQALLGRAYHDMSLYAEAERHLAAAHSADPTMTTSMDIYSLVLFHLNREVALSTLAQHLMLIDPTCSAAHVASGNTFSLQREHGIALKCFKRAILIAPKDAYPYTLAGYEALELGNRDEARNLFRSAIRCERRHWNAWSGLGQICLLDGNPLYAEFHYKAAVAINAQNAVLFDLLGWVTEMGTEDREQALEYYDRALSLNPYMAMTVLKKAELLQALGQHETAHEHYLKACALAPDEARIHILLAKSYMRLAGGKFAEVERAASSRGRGEDEIITDATGFVSKHIAAGGAPGDRARPNDVPEYGVGYERAIAHHLTLAIDLDPRSVRAIRAMGEGAHAALQSAAKKGGIFDPSGMASMSVSLNDASTSHFIADQSNTGGLLQVHADQEHDEDHREGGEGEGDGEADVSAPGNRAEPEEEEEDEQDDQEDMEPDAEDETMSMEL